MKATRHNGRSGKHWKNVPKPLFLKTNLFSDIIISIMGGIFHNVGQLLMAMLFFSSTVFMYYLPYLMLFGILSGIVIGILGEIIYLKIGNQLKKRG